MKLRLPDLFVDMRGSRMCWVTPDLQLTIRENSDKSWTLTCMLVSDRVWTVTDSLDKCIELFNAKWTLRYVKKW